MTETKTTIMERLLDAVSDNWDKSEGSFIYDALKPVAVEMFNFYDLLENRKEQMSINTASGSYLENRLKEFGFYRKQALAAAGYVTITGASGTKVEINTLVASDKAVYKITDTGTIDASGTVTLPITCTSTGTAGNADIGAVNRFPITISGLISVVNTSAVTGGSDTETDNEIKARFFDYMKKPSIPGNKAYYEKLAAEVDGVGKAQCIPLWNGAGTVKVVIADTSMKAANNTLVNSVQSHINDNRFIGADVTVAAATELTVNVACKLSTDSTVAESEVYTAVCSVLSEYFKKLSFPDTTGTYITYAKILTLIMSVEGVSDCTELKINNGTANIPIPSANVVVLGVVTVE